MWSYLILGITTVKYLKPRRAIIAALGCYLLFYSSFTLGDNVSDGARAGHLPQPVILVLGDSISAAYGIKTEDSWVTLLDNHLQEQDLPSVNHYRIVNASISGETSGGGLRRLPDLLERYRPAIVIIELGGNDGLRGFPIAQLRANLDKLVTATQIAGAKVLLVGMRIPPNYGSRYTQLFHDSYSLTAEKFSIPLVPFLLDGVAARPDLMQGDGIHPKAEAQPLLLHNLLPYLKKML